MSGGGPTQAFSFASPLYAIPAGNCLRFEVYGGVANVDVTVSGYLTNDLAFNP